MDSAVATAIGEPTWDVARLFPEQGSWSEEEYCALTTNRLVELSDGCLDVLPMPTEAHQLLVAFLYNAVFGFVMPRKLGTVLFAPLRVRLWKGKFREPDVVFMLAANAHRRGNQFWSGADLVMEVVSEDDPERDLKLKRREYARAGIREYWIVDPRQHTMTVLVLRESGKSYQVAGAYGCGEQAESLLLPGLVVDVDQAFGQP